MTTPGTAGRSGTRTDLAARFVIRAATLAPSVHNTQPWRFGISGDAFQLYADVRHRLPATDPAGREMVISCGAALFNLRLAMRMLGFAARVTPFPDPGRDDLLAEIRWGWNRPPSLHEQSLFRVMSRRHTHRGMFLDTAVPAYLLAALEGAAQSEDARLVFVQDEPRLDRLGALVGEAERRERADPGIAAELARWTPAPGDGRLDGVPAHAYPRQPDGARLATRDFAMGTARGHVPRVRRSCPATQGVVAVLATRGDRRLDWLRAGSALQSVLLHGAAHRISAAFHTQPLELPDLRAHIEHDIGTGGHPQMLLRLGYTDRTRSTPRRPVGEVLVDRAV
ncbi:Acg family FMN-binding oxidoreductase [Actinomadura formosensis]|uniref:Acg family FMN-binding oxidoreductase n=1 Tax=Actinomadura formosensis TaxID=60706 RepID=UPI000830830F|nr:hypothetical protein [Actinomadura formosensis]